MLTGILGRLGRGDVFVNAETVAFGVLEPGGLLRSEQTDMIHGLQSGRVGVFEDLPCALQLIDAGCDVGQPEADRLRVGLGSVRFGEQREGAAAHDVDELSVPAHTARLRPQAAFVEGPSAVDVLSCNCLRRQFFEPCTAYARICFNMSR